MKPALNLPIFLLCFVSHAKKRNQYFKYYISFGNESDTRTWEDANKTCASSGKILLHFPKNLIQYKILSNKILNGKGRNYKNKEFWFGLISKNGKYYDSNNEEIFSKIETIPDILTKIKMCGYFTIVRNSLSFNYSSCVDMKKHFICETPRADKRNLSYAISKIVFGEEEDMLTWEEANEKCKRSRGRLVVLLSQRNKFLVVHGKGASYETTKFWIGLVAEGKKPKWINGKESRISFGWEGKRIFSKRACGFVELRGFQTRIAFDNCTRSLRHYICEIPGDLLLTTNAHSAHSKSTTHFDHELAFSTTIELKTAKTKFQDFYEKLKYLKAINPFFLGLSTTLGILAMICCVLNFDFEHIKSLTQETKNPKRSELSETSNEEVPLDNTKLSS